METTTRSLELKDGRMDLFEARADGEAKGAVIVVQEAFGVNDHIRDVVRRFAASGFDSVAPHLFHRSGDPLIAYEDMDSIWPHLAALSEDGLTEDLDATLVHLEELGHDSHRVGLVGFCMGGTVSFIAATKFSVGASVSFYGGGIVDGRFGAPGLIDLAQALRAPWLGLYGDRDKGIAVEDVEALRSAVDASGVASELVRYSDAGHAFHCDARPAMYHRASAEDAWQRTLAWLGKHLDGA